MSVYSRYISLLCQRTLCHLKMKERELGVSELGGWGLDLGKAVQFLITEVLGLQFWVAVKAVSNYIQNDARTF